MDLRPSPEQEQLIEAFASLYAKESPPDRVRAAEPGGFDKALWERVLDLGVVAMAVGEDAGGWGASLLDLALIAEQQGRAVAAVPIIEAQAAARFLERIGTGPLAEVLAGERLVTLALRPAHHGRATMVPAAAVADDAVVVVGDSVVLAPLVDRRTPVENLGSMPVADVDIDVAAATVLGSGPAALAAFAAALDDWLVLTAAALVGIGARGLEIGVAYVKERRAWGRPIGSYQGIAHRLADSAAAVDGARLLAWEAAWSAAEDPGRLAELAAMAFAFAHESARDATYRALHFHGGYGFMMEYDIQLYYRRARAWATVFAEPRAVYERAADRRYGSRGEPR